MTPTVEILEPFILEGRESIKSIVGHLMAIKGGETGRLREALHETRALRECSHRAEFNKVAHLCAHMEALMEAAELEGAEQIQESLEVLCDMCAHIVLYMDTVLLYADTFAMLVEFPWMRDTLARRLTYLGSGPLPADSATLDLAPLEIRTAVVRVRAENGEADPESTIEELRRLHEDGAPDAHLAFDVSALRSRIINRWNEATVADRTTVSDRVPLA